MRPDINNGHINSKKYHNVYNNTAIESGLYQLELSEILLNDLAFKSKYSLENLIPEFKQIYEHVQDPKNKPMFEQYAENCKTGNISIKIPSLSLVRYISKKVKITQEAVIMSLLAENIISCGDFDAHIWNILDYYYYIYTMKKHDYEEFLTTIPGYKVTRERKI